MGGKIIFLIVFIIAMVISIIIGITLAKYDDGKKNGKSRKIKPYHVRRRIW